MLPRFDTGHWSRYSLGVESSLHYQDYVIGLLKLVATRTDDPVWTDAAQRFELYETEPPLMTGPDRDAARLPAPRGRRARRARRPLLALEDLEGGARRRRQGGGRLHLVRRLAHVPLHAARPRAGNARGPARARSPDGNPGATDLGSFKVERDTTPPVLAAAKADGRVFWRAKDGESACCRVRLELQRSTEHRWLTPSQSKGSASIPPGYWLVTAIARRRRQPQGEEARARGRGETALAP